MINKFTVATGRMLPTLFLLMLIACNSLPATPEPTPTEALAVTTTLVATTAPQPTEPLATEPTITVVFQPTTPLATASPQAVATSDLSSTLGSELSDLILTTMTAEIATGVTNVSTLLLEQDGQVTLWAAHTAGFLSGENQHSVWLYQHEPAGWQALGQTNLTYIKSLLPDSLTAAEVSGQGIWVQLSGGLEDGGNCYALLHFDANLLTTNSDHCHAKFASPGVTDINRDGIADLRLNNSDDFLLCTVCGVSQPDYKFLTWSDSGFWQEVTLTLLDESSQATFKEENNELVRLAQAGLWQEAAQVAKSIEQLDPVTNWNVAIVESHHELLVEQLASSPFPLLTNLFYGDYEAAVMELRLFPPAAIFVDRPEIVVGTPIENNITVMANAIVSATAKALAYDPNLVEAQFLRGWALYLISPNDPNAQRAIEQADRLAPTDPLFADSLFYFYNHLNYSP